MTLTEKTAALAISIVAAATLSAFAADKKKVEVLTIKEEAAAQVEQKTEKGEAKRFIDNDDGTVLDKNTGLIWLKDANFMKTRLPIQTARQAIEEMNEGKRPNFGFKNWRIPTLKEFESIVDKTKIYPALTKDHPFKHVENNFYWTATPGNADVAETIWMIDLASGTGLIDYVSYCNFRYVWPVRSSDAAKTKSGKVLASGLNEHGQLGDGSTEDERDLFQPAIGLSDVTKISAGAEHAVALKSDGSVWIWGRNAEGQLGDGTAEDKSVPVMLKGLWNVTDVAAGMFHTIALKADGTVWAWGRNYNGQLGDGTNEDRQTPVQVRSLTNIIRIFPGLYHTFALKADGTVWAWGWNNYGQLGDGTTIDSRTPVQIDKLKDIVNMAAGIHHSVALKSDGTIWAWGWNMYGLLGDGTKEDSKVPVQVKGLSAITDISAGMYHTMALKSDGTVWTWGKNEYSQLGTSSTAQSSLAGMVEGISGIQKIAAGMYHSVVLKSDGTVWVWGQDMRSKKEKATPVQKKDIKTGIIGISAGKNYTLAITGSETN